MRFTSSCTSTVLAGLFAASLAACASTGKAPTTTPTTPASAASTAADPDAPLVLVELETEVGDLALDATHVYLTLTGDGVVQRIAKTGGLVEIVASDQPSPDRLLVDGDHVYWTTYEEGRAEIRHWSRGRNKWTTIALDTGEIRALALRGGEIVYVATTETGAKVRAVPRAGGAYRELAASDASSFLAVAGEELCWGGGYKLWRASASGTVTLVSDQFQLLGLAAGADGIYAWDATAVRRLVPGKAPETIAEGDRPVVASTSRYLVIGEAGATGGLRVRSTDGAEQRLAESGRVERLVVDERTAFWLTRGDEGPTLVRLALPTAVTATASATVPTAP